MAKSTDVKLSDREIVGAYSVDENGNYKNNLSCLKYLNVLDLKMNPIDLNKIKYEDGSQKYDIMDRIKNMTKYIKENPQNFIKNKRVDADFVCFRGGLSNIMSSPYINNDWIIKAVMLKETIYFILELKYPENKDTTYQSYGFKFESFVLADHPNSNPKGFSNSAIKKDEFCVLMTRKLDDDLKVLFGAEIDGVKSTNVIESLDDLRTSELIETKLRIDDGKKNYLDRNRTIEWWCQSYIASVNEIHVGYHNAGIIKSHKTIETKKLSPLKKKSPNDANDHNEWKRSECIKRLKSILTDIKSQMNGIDVSNIGFSFELKSYNEGKFKEIKEIENFLPQEYVTFIESL